ncbi:MAG: PCMD domain-containing protein, partial [Muribaculaceae bacterium]|nr:PCMD domain-containing protein [Muribaculaceae bacterium]
NNLSPLTDYETRVYSGEDFGATVQFTTGPATQVPDSDFENWWLDGKVWCPWLEGGSPFWGTGNVGAATLGNSNTTPTDDTPSGSGYAARLETRFVGIGALGKLAAGNLFAGTYLRTVGTNGVLSFGRPFTERPVKLQGHFKYSMKEISHTYGKEFANLVGQPDTCIIWVALIDSDEPFEIRTAPSDRHLFDPDGPEVVAYGKMQKGQSVDNYIPFEFELEYKSTSRVPKYIMITASASKYGDYFTGGNGSTLYIDDFKLLYSY